MLKIISGIKKKLRIKPEVKLQDKFISEGFRFFIETQIWREKNWLA